MSRNSLDKLAAEDETSLGSDSAELKSLSNEPDELIWISVCGGGCRLNPSSLPKWFQHSKYACTLTLGALCFKFLFIARLTN